MIYKSQLVKIRWIVVRFVKNPIEYILLKDSLRENKRGGLTYCEPSSEDNGN